MCFLWGTDKPIEFSWALNKREDDGYVQNCDSYTKISYSPLRSHSFCMFHPFHPHWLHNTNNISWKEQIIQHFISTASSYILLLTSKYYLRTIEWVPRVLFTGLKRLGCEADHFYLVSRWRSMKLTSAPQTSSWRVSQLRNSKSCTFTSPYSRTPWIYVFPLTWGTKTHAYTTGEKRH
jgi:hypothetical protein